MYLPIMSVIVRISRQNPPARSLAVRDKAEMTHGKLHLVHPGDRANDRNTTVIFDRPRRFFLCEPPLTWFRMTPAILTSGSNAWNPFTIAAALRVMLCAETTSTTGRSSVFAIAAVLPVSSSASAPL